MSSSLVPIQIRQQEYRNETCLVLTNMPWCSNWMTQNHSSCIHHLQTHSQCTNICISLNNYYILSSTRMNTISFWWQGHAVYYHTRHWHTFHLLYLGLRNCSFITYVDCICWTMYFNTSHPVMTICVYFDTRLIKFLQCKLQDTWTLGFFEWHVISYGRLTY